MQTNSHFTGFTSTPAWTRIFLTAAILLSSVVPMAIGTASPAMAASPIENLSITGGYFVRVNLTDPNVEIKVGLANNDTGGYQTLAGQASRYQGKGYLDSFAINADYFSSGCSVGTNCGQGLTYINGERRTNNPANGETWKGRGNIGFNADRSVEGNVGDGQTKRYQVVAGGPWIVRGGGAPICQGQLEMVGGAQKTFFPATGEWLDNNVLDWCWITRPMTLIGYNADRTQLFMGVSTGGSTIIDLANRLKEQGATDVLRLDSGSSTSYVRSGGASYNSAGSAIANHIAVIVKQGSQPGPGPAPTPTPAPGGGQPTGGNVELIGVNVPGSVQPGQRFIPEVTVRLQNGQQLRQDRGDMLRHVGGTNYTGFPHVAATGTTGSGATYTFRFYDNNPFVAPNEAGAYESVWRVWAGGQWVGPDIAIRFSVGGSGGGGGSGPNQTPAVPRNLQPGDWGELRTGDAPELCWDAVSDPDGDAVQYWAEVFESANIGNSGWISSRCWRADFLAGKYFGYQWRVKSRDSRGAESGWSERSRFTLSPPSWNPPPPGSAPVTVPTLPSTTSSWWDLAFGFRRPLQIDGGAGGLAAGRLIKLDMVDLDALAAAGKVRPDFKDLRVVLRLDANVWQEVARVVYSPWDIEFQLLHGLPAGLHQSYYLYYGNPAAGDPPTFSHPQGFWVDMHATKWWDSYVGTWEFNQAMDFGDVCGAPLEHRSRVGSAFDDSDRFRGRIFLPATGAWTFRVYTNDAYYLTISGREVGRFSGYDGPRWVTAGSAEFKAGWHTFDFGNMWVNCGPWKVAMEGPGFPNQIIPAHFLQKVWDNLSTASVTVPEEPYVAPEPTCAEIAHDKVVLYDRSLCQGDWIPFAEEGIFNLTTFDDKASSVYVPAGWSVRLYAEPNGQGTSQCAEQSKWDLGVDPYPTGALMADTVSSVEVFRNSACQLPLELVQPLTWAPAQPRMGEPVTARFSVRNRGSYPVALQAIGIVVRPGACGNAWDCGPGLDFPHSEAVVLAPGAEFQFVQWRIFSEDPGNFTLHPAFANQDWWWYQLPGAPVTTLSVEPGLVMERSLTLEPETPQAGEAVTARFTLRNESARAFELLVASVATRGPGCATVDNCPIAPDFPAAKTVNIAPGASFTYQDSYLFLQQGQGYFALGYYKVGADDWRVVGDPKRFAVTPGLELASALRLDPAQPIAGMPVTITFALTNRGARPVVIPHLTAAARGPNCTQGTDCSSVQDFQLASDVRVAPGETWTYQATRIFGTAGTAYFVEPAVADAHWWWFKVANTQSLSFSVMPGLVLEHELEIFPPSPLAGEPVLMRFALRNQSRQPIRLATVAVGLRGPNCQEWACGSPIDFPHTGPITIGAGATYTYENTLPLFTPGSGYFANAFYVVEPEVWVPLGARTDFTVLPGLRVIAAPVVEPQRPMAGEVVTTSYQVRNEGATAVTLHSFGMVVRPESCGDDWACIPNLDFPPAARTTVPPGGVATYRIARIFEQAGRYRLWPAMADTRWWWYTLPGTDSTLLSIGGGLVLAQELTLDPPQPLAGEAVTARFSLRNDGSRPVHLERLAVGSRGPDCTDWNCGEARDFSWRQSIILQPGEQYDYEGTLAFPQQGPQFFAQAFYSIDGHWQPVGRRTTFVVAQGLELSQPVTITPSALSPGVAANVRYAVVNAGQRPLTVAALGAVIQPASCSKLPGCWDAIPLNPQHQLRLAPGERYDLDSWFTVEQPGERLQVVAAISDGVNWWQPVSGASSVSTPIKPAPAAPARPTLAIAEPTGAPGSYFLLIGSGFPAGASVPIRINGSGVGEIPVNSTGGFLLVLLTTTGNPIGVYQVEAGDSVTTFTLAATATRRTAAGANSMVVGSPPNEQPIRWYLYVPAVSR